MKIYIIDYGMGNLRSVKNAFDSLDCQAVIIDKPAELNRADKIVLPGVGAFGDAMNNLKNAGWLEALNKEVIQKSKHFLGICLGMQVLAGIGTEHGIHKGLGWLSGSVNRLSGEQANFRIPHIGWNDVKLVEGKMLYNGLGDIQSFYFVHSYVFCPEDTGVVSGICDYGGDFVASIEKNNIFAVQFHPEKSHKIGLTVLKNFVLAKN